MTNNKFWVGRKKESAPRDAPRPKPPPLNEEEIRRIVSSAIADGRVTKCPPRWAAGSAEEAAQIV